MSDASSDTSPHTPRLVEADPSAAPSAAAPAGFILSHHTRDLFTAYYRFTHHRELTDADILALVNAAHDRAIRTHPYGCVKEFRFAYPRIVRHPRYAQLIRNNPRVGELRVLDVGSCMGSDVRQLLLDGVQRENVLGLELERGFIDIGLDVLFQDTALMSTRFITHDILQSNYAQHDGLQAFIHQRQLDLVYCGSVYHLLNEPDTQTLTRHVYQLLPAGGIFFGRTGGSVDPIEPAVMERRGRQRFLHSAATFTSMCLQYGFVDVEFVQLPGDMDESDTGSHFGAARAFFGFYAKKAAES